MTDQLTYIGSIPPMTMQVAHPEIYLRITTGRPLTKAQGDELANSPFVIRYEDVDLSDL